LDLNKAGNGVDAGGCCGGRDGENEDEKNGGKWKVHDGFVGLGSGNRERRKEETLYGGRNFFRNRQVSSFYFFFKAGLDRRSSCFAMKRQVLRWQFCFDKDAFFY